MGSAHLTNGLMTAVSDYHETKNYDYETKSGVRTGTPGDAQMLLYFPKPFPAKAVILSASLRLVATPFTQTGTKTATLRPLAQSVNFSKVNYVTRPTQFFTGRDVVLSKTGPQALDNEWIFNVTAQMQSVSNGDAWYGWRLTGNFLPIVYFYGPTWPTSGVRPVLDVTWSEPSVKPTGLLPGGGRAVSIAKPVVRSTYVAASGSTMLAGVRVQTSATSDFTAPSWDSGEVLATAPELDLATWTATRSTAIGTTLSSTAITAPAATFTTADLGASVTGTGIPTGATISAVTSGTAATISAAATATGAPSVTIARAFPGLSDNQVIFWRMMLRDGAGLWTVWSDPETFKRDIKGTLTVTNPSSGGLTVTDVTPPILWTFAGETQAAYQVSVQESFDPARANVARPTWTSGKITSTATSFTLPENVLVATGRNYDLSVRIWDAKPRESTPGDPAYVEVLRTFSFVTSSTVPATVALTVTADAIRPRVTLTWTRSVAPDAFNVLRNGRIIAAGLLPQDISTSATSYLWRDNTPSPQRNLVYTVQAVQNKVASSSNPTATTIVRSTGTWLRDVTTGDEIAIGGRASRDWTMSEQTSVIEPIADGSPKVLITQSQGLLEGSVAGPLLGSALAGFTDEGMRDTYLRMRNSAGRKFYLTSGDYTFAVVCRAFTYAQRPLAADKIFDVSFEFYQQDSLDTLTTGA